MSRAASPSDLVAAARAAGIADERVLAAIGATPRAGFVPGDYLAAAYRDEPVPIGHRQVTTQPSLSARMIEGLHLQSGDHVLEIGTGLGFQTALLARLAARVISIERWPDLAGQARRNIVKERERWLNSADHRWSAPATTSQPSSRRSCRPGSCPARRCSRPTAS